MYIRWIYSLLVASDYYAHRNLMNDADFSEIADLNNIDKWNNAYATNEIERKISPVSDRQNIL